MADSYVSVTWVANELVTSTKLNQAMTNDSGFHDGTALGDGIIVTRHLAASGSLQVPFVNLASGKVWWEELTRATLGSPALTLATSTFTARKYIQLRIIAKQSGAAISPWIRFNGDTGNNYSLRYSANYSAGTALGSQNGFSINPGSTQTDIYAIVDLYNEASKEKNAYILATDLNATGAANVPNILTSNAKWANTANQITSISLFESGAANNFGTGTEIVVLGHD